MVVGIDTHCVDCGQPMRSCVMPAHCGCKRARELLERVEGKEIAGDESSVTPCTRVDAENPFRFFEAWLEWLDSHDGRLHRRLVQKQTETEYDLVATVPPTYTLLLLKDLRALVMAGRELQRLRAFVAQQEGRTP